MLIKPFLRACDTGFVHHVTALKHENIRWLPSTLVSSDLLSRCSISAESRRRPYEACMRIVTRLEDLDRLESVMCISDQLFNSERSDGEDVYQDVQTPEDPVLQYSLRNASWMCKHRSPTSNAFFKGDYNWCRGDKGVLSTKMKSRRTSAASSELQIVGLVYHDLLEEPCGTLSSRGAEPPRQKEGAGSQLTVHTIAG